jgi:hypothetical protein
MLDWQQRILDEVSAERDTRPPRRSIGLNYPTSMHSNIVAACRARDMSLTSYTRRALMAVATYDLGLDWFTVMADEPPMCRFGTNSQERQLESGLGDFGPWKIISMEDYRDERR